MNPGINCTGQMADSVYGEQFADVKVVNRVRHGGGGAMLWAGVSYGQRTQLDFIDGNLNAQKLHWVPFVCHHLMFQHNNTQPHLTRICTQFLEAEIVPVLPWPAYSPEMSPIEHVWMLWLDMYDSAFQFPFISSTFAQPLKRSGTTFHRPQSTA